MIRLIFGKVGNHRELVQRLHWRFELARRSRIVRVDNHQIEFISTHRKIGHSASIKWYQLSRLIGEFIEYFYFLQSTKTKQKFVFRLDPCPSNPFSLALSFNNLLC